MDDEARPKMEGVSEGPKPPLSCRVVRAGEPFVGKQGLTYAAGVSAETVGARGIHMRLVRIPPGGRAKAHKHVAHESAIYGISGESGVWHGELSSSIPSFAQAIFSTSRPTCRTCRITPARARRASR